MKRVIKLWDILLVAIMGFFGTGCLLDPPAPEYGVEPMYGVPAAFQEADEELQEQTQETEFPAQ